MMEANKMNKNKLQIHTSPLTNTIFCGKVLKSGIWAANKQDMTIDALVAVCKHVETFGKPVEISNESGELEYKITVESFKKIKEK